MDNYTDLLRKLRWALADCRLDFDEVCEKAREGEVQILETEGAVAITALVSSGSFKTCCLIVVAGDLSRMTELDAKVVAHAKANGCQAIETAGRFGWSRVKAPAPGYEPVGIKYRKMLEN